MAFPLILFLLLGLRTPASCSCDPPHRLLLSLAFSSVSNFPPPAPAPAGECIRQLRLPSKNLSGAISWMFLRNITTLETLDLSSNALEGSIPAGFWSSPALAHVNLADNNLGGQLRLESSGLRLLNLSGNRFTAVTGLSSLRRLRVLDLRRNKLRDMPPDMESLHQIEYLDVSDNSMAGKFPGQFPATAGLLFLNLSYNNLTGEVDSEALEKFGSSAFAKGGVFHYTSASGHQKSNGKREKTGIWRRIVITGASAGAGVLVVGLMIAGAVCCARQGRPEKETVRAAVAEEVGWVKEARWGSPVVMFEKPLMGLKFADLAVATSGFGKESLMAEGGRSGPVYRAVLPGDMNVVVRVVDGGERPPEEKEAAAAFREISRLRHRNVLPLLGYCISGKETLLLYEYMERGDLHRWLHELPAGRPDGEDWTGDTWEILPAGSAASAAGDWPTRHRIALGIARGLAFLHQGWVGSHTPVVHGHLVPSNILLSDDLEPCIADFANGSSGDAAPEDDVYSYGVLVMELVTGHCRRADEVARVREIVRSGRAADIADAVDRRLLLDEEWEKEAVECLRVGYLCTAGSPEKRPSMLQVVALLKDIRPVPAAGDSGGGASSSS